MPDGDAGASADNCVQHLRNICSLDRNFTPSTQTPQREGQTSFFEFVIGIDKFVHGVHRLANDSSSKAELLSF